jgi:hypothetical protein
MGPHPPGINLLDSATDLKGLARFAFTTLVQKSGLENER